MTGYLTKVKTENMENGDKLEDRQTALRIPNTEVMDVFRKSVVEWFNKKAVESDRRGLFETLWSGEAEKLTEILSDLLFDTISYHDYAESFYHAFVTGLMSCAGYIVESNYENELEKECGSALSQIEEKQYARKLERSGFRKVLRYGIAFYRKECLVKTI